VIRRPYTKRSDTRRPKTKWMMRAPLALRLTWGSTLLFLPAQVLTIMDRATPTAGACGIMRVLGGRHILQATAEWRFGAPAARLGIAVDALHVATDVGFAGRDRRWRRPAGTDAAVTAGFVILGLAQARRRSA
jgi:hypothetical protein